MPSRSHNRSSVHAPPSQRDATISTSPPPAAAAACSGVSYPEIDATSRASAARSTWSARPKLWITLATELARKLGSGVSQQKATVLAGEFERSFQRILDARENRCHHRTTGLMLSQMQELVRQVHNALTEPWNKGVVARNRVGCTERPRSHVFSAELFAGVPCGISRRLPC